MLKNFDFVNDKLIFLINVNNTYVDINVYGLSHKSSFTCGEHIFGWCEQPGVKSMSSNHKIIRVECKISHWTCEQFTNFYCPREQVGKSFYNWVFFKTQAELAI